MKRRLAILLLVPCAAIACKSDSKVAANAKGSGLAVFAGVPEGWGSVDGIGTAARFYGPAGVAVDGAGNVFVADSSNNTIRKITPAGVVTTLAGSAGVQGSTDGAGKAARFDYPRGAAVDGAGNLFVTDSNNNTIRKITPDGEATTFAGAAGSSESTDGTGSAARFYAPGGVAVDGAGNVFVADSKNNNIRKITAAGAVTTLAGSAGALQGSADGAGTAARFDTPQGVGVDGVGNVFVADSKNNTIRKITPDGAVTTFAGAAGSSGSTDGTVAAARFLEPFGLAVDSAGNVFVADSSNHTIRKITPAGEVSTLAGAAGSAGNADGTGATARFFWPAGLAVDGVGNVFVADSGNDAIRKITPAGVVTTLAGTVCSPGSADGTGTAARFNWPAGVAVDGTGNVFVADTANHTIRKITPAGVVTTLAGSVGLYGSSDGTGQSARFSSPQGAAVDGAGNVFVADSGNSAIRKITPAGVVTTLAGDSKYPFRYPHGVAVDGAGNVFVADTYSDTIRKITPEGVVTTLAGSASGSTDGTGADASFDLPEGVAVDGAGNVFVADTFSKTIRKITSAGVVTTLAGSAYSLGSADGTGAAARFTRPSSLAVDRAGNVFVADWNNNAIRKITPAGVVSTVVGVAGPTVVGNFPGPLPASIVLPTGGVAIDPSSGKLYITLPDAVMVASISD